MLNCFLSNGKRLFNYLFFISIMSETKLYTLTEISKLISVHESSLRKRVVSKKIKHTVIKNGVKKYNTYKFELIKNEFIINPLKQYQKTKTLPVFKYRQSDNTYIYLPSKLNFIDI